MLCQVYPHFTMPLQLTKNTSECGNVSYLPKVTIQIDLLMGYYDMCQTEIDVRRMKCYVDLFSLISIVQ